MTSRHLQEIQQTKQQQETSQAPKKTRRPTPTSTPAAGRGRCHSDTIGGLGLGVGERSAGHGAAGLGLLLLRRGRRDHAAGQPHGASPRLGSARLGSTPRLGAFFVVWRLRVEQGLAASLVESPWCKGNPKEVVKQKVFHHVRTWGWPNTAASIAERLDKQSRDARVGAKSVSRAPITAKCRRSRASNAAQLLSSSQILPGSNGSNPIFEELSFESATQAVLVPFSFCFAF